MPTSDWPEITFLETLLFTARAYLDPSIGSLCSQIQEESPTTEAVEAAIAEAQEQLKAWRYSEARTVYSSEPVHFKSELGSAHGPSRECGAQIIANKHKHARCVEKYYFGHRLPSQ